MTEETRALAVSLSVCRLYCSGDIGTLWPKPTGPVKIQQKFAVVRPDKFVFNFNGLRDTTEKYFGVTKERFLEQVNKMVPKGVKLAESGMQVVVTVAINNGDPGKM